MTDKKDRTVPKHDVVIRHAEFRYHIVEDSPTGATNTAIHHASRGQQITVNDEDYDRGVKYGAFFDPKRVKDGDITAMSGLETLEQRNARLSGTNSRGDTDSAADDDAFDPAKADDDELLAFMARTTPDILLAKVSGEDEEVLERVLRLEYQRTDGEPAPEIVRVISDLLGKNPEEDEDGNWVNQPDEDEVEEPVKQQRKARTGARRKNARSTQQDSGAGA